MASEGFVLPIRRKGLFSQDSFFSDIKDDFNDAIKDTLKRWETKGSSGAGDRWTAYRRLRSHDRKEEDEKVASVTQTDEAVTIALDMSDFVSGQIDVRTEGQCAVVEASLGSKMSYNRRFPLPRNVNVDGVVAAMSDDGILTITAPRKDRKVPVAADVSSPKGASSSSTIRNMQATTTIQSSQTQGGNGRVIPLAVDDSQASAADATNLSSAIAELEKQILQGDTRSASSLSATTGSTMGTSASSVSSTTSISKRVLPIMRRGQFFKDSFFKDVQRDFESALNNTIKGWDHGDSFSSSSNAPTPPTFSRRVKESQVLDGGCTSGITATDDAYKVIVDMGEFADGKIGVKSMEGGVLVTAEMKAGETGTKSFSKSFALPGVKDATKVEAVVSTDGVLTITAPRA